MRLWLGFDQFEQRSSVNTWVYRIALMNQLDVMDRGLVLLVADMVPLRV